MTKKTAKGAKPAAKKSKRLALNKQTVKDLTPREASAKGVKGGRTGSEQVVCSLIVCVATR